MVRRALAHVNQAFLSHASWERKSGKLRQAGWGTPAVGSISL